MLRLYRVTLAGTKLAGRLVLVDGRVRFCLEDQDARSLFEELEHDGVVSSALQKWVRPEDGELFLDAVVDALRTTSYWIAERESDPLAASGAFLGPPWKPTTTLS
jgi:hypothetical protein